MRSTHKLVEMALLGQDHMHWYSQARDECHDAAEIIGTCPERFIEILAVTSPRVSVTRNVKYAIMLSVEPFTRPSGMLRKVYASYLRMLKTGDILGRKTKPFAAALHGDVSAIPLDTWMCKALGIPAKPSAVQFREATRRVAECADYLGWWGCEAQAAIWATAVRAAGRNVPAVSAITLALDYVNNLPLQGVR